MFGGRRKYWCAFIVVIGFSCYTITFVFFGCFKYIFLLKTLQKNRKLEFVFNLSKIGL